MYSRREFHEDHAALLVDYFRNEKGTFLHLLKLWNPGTLRVNPAQVRPIYPPQCLSTSKRRTGAVQ